MHTVAKAITDHIRDPELMVNAFRAMFGKQPVEFYVRQREKMRAADQRDAFLMSNYVAVGGAHPVTMASQGLNVYERMEFDRQLQLTGSGS